MQACVERVGTPTVHFGCCVPLNEVGGENQVALMEKDQQSRMFLAHVVRPQGMELGLDHTRNVAEADTPNRWRRDVSNSFFDCLSVILRDRINHATSMHFDVCSRPGRLSSRVECFSQGVNTYVHIVGSPTSLPSPPPHPKSVENTSEQDKMEVLESMTRTSRSESSFTVEKCEVIRSAKNSNECDRINGLESRIRVHRHLQH